MINIPDRACEGCLLRKQQKNSFPVGKSQKAIYFGHNKYILTFIDDFARKTQIYFLKENFDAFNKFKEFKVLVERQSGCNIKILRYDRGGEFTSNL